MRLIIDVPEKDFTDIKEGHISNIQRDAAIDCIKNGIVNEPGKWINILRKNGRCIALRCSRCGNSPKYAVRSIYCPNCGTRMED